MILQQDIGFAMFIIQQSPTGFFQQFIDLNASFCFFVHFSLTPMEHGLILVYRNLVYEASELLEIMVNVRIVLVLVNHILRSYG